jgi:hypothetical protein
MILPQARFPRHAPGLELEMAAAREDVLLEPAQWRSAVKSTESTPLRMVVAIVFCLLTVGLFGVAVWAVGWAIQSLQPLGGGLALIVLGLGAATAYEASAVWPGSQRQTITEIAHAAFMAHRFIWVGIYLSIVLVAGLLTMHFTRLVQPDWALLGATVLVFVNGALIAYWFEWLP